MNYTLSGELCLATRNETIEGVAGIAVEIEDTGKGMSADVLDKIFDPFFTTKQREGTGLGLSISQTIVTRYDGTIRAKSEPGAGTEFFVWFPVSES